MRAILSVALSFALLNAPMPASSADTQVVSIADSAARIASGCTPTKSKTADASEVDCTWTSGSHAGQMFRLSRKVYPNSELLTEIHTFPTSSQPQILAAALGGYLAGKLALNAPRKWTPPKGFSIVGAPPELDFRPGPNKMFGICTKYEVRARSATESWVAVGIYCGAVGRKPNDLLIVSAMLTQRYPRGKQVPTGFTESMKRMVGTLTVATK